MEAIYANLANKMGGVQTSTGQNITNFFLPLAVDYNIDDILNDSSTISRIKLSVDVADNINNVSTLNGTITFNPSRFKKAGDFTDGFLDISGDVPTAISYWYHRDGTGIIYNGPAFNIEHTTNNIIKNEYKGDETLPMSVSFLAGHGAVGRIVSNGTKLLVTGLKASNSSNYRFVLSNMDGSSTGIEFIAPSGAPTYFSIFRGAAISQDRVVINTNINQVDIYQLDGTHIATINDETGGQPATSHSEFGAYIIIKDSQIIVSSPYYNDEGGVFIYDLNGVFIEKHDINAFSMVWNGTYFCTKKYGTDTIISVWNPDWTSNKTLNSVNFGFLSTVDNYVLLTPFRDNGSTHVYDSDLNLLTVLPVQSTGQFTTTISNDQIHSGNNHELVDIYDLNGNYLSSYDSIHNQIVDSQPITYITNIGSFLLIGWYASVSGDRLRFHNLDGLHGGVQKKSHSMVKNKDNKINNAMLNIDDFSSESNTPVSTSVTAMHQTFAEFAEFNTDHTIGSTYNNTLENFRFYDRILTDPDALKIKNESLPILITQKGI